jgi:hypothetical protein
VTDRYGDFRFPMPLPPDWYRLAIEDDAIEGGARVWLAQERRPGGLVLVARPRAEAPSPYTD